MHDSEHVAVIDIGKSNAKVAVVDTYSLNEIGVSTRPNTVLPGPPYPHFDIEGIWQFICDALRQLNAAHRIDAISVTTHGASIVLLDGNGDLATPMLDYEFDGPETLATEYDLLRPDFSETGSPRLGMGLNVGAQLHWLLNRDEGLLDRTSSIVTYPQYWSYRLTGVLANEVTSLGCHTDLWCPLKKRFSSLADKLGIAGKLAPVKQASSVLGFLLPQIAETIGLHSGVPVFCGIHDSNASLYPHLLSRKGPFSVISTGTWVIVLAIGAGEVDLDPARDTLINVNAFGDPVPSARFMGGREFDLVMDGQSADCSVANVEKVLEDGVMLFPAVDPRSGPFQHWHSCWTINETQLQAGERLVAVSYYLALVTAECLAMTGARGPILVEGPFSRNTQYLEMLGTATGRPVFASKQSVTGTSIGAALLAVEGSTKFHAGGSGDEANRAYRSELSQYARLWFEQIRAREASA